MSRARARPVNVRRLAGRAGAAAARRAAAVAARLRAPGWPGRAAAGAGGALVTLSFAPFGVRAAGALGAMALLALLRGQAARECAARGWWHGFGMFGAGVSWVYVSIHDFGGAGVALAATLTVLFCAGLALTIALAAWLYGLAFARRAGPGWWLGFAAMWMFAEWTRLWLLGGFPWLYLGYAHVDTPLAGWVPVGGAFAASLAVAYSAAAACAAWSASASGRVWALASVALVWGAGAALREVDWVRFVDAPPVRASLVQGNIPLEIKWLRAWRSRNLGVYREQTERSWDSDLIVWPEGAMPLYHVPGRGLIGWADAEARRRGVAVLAGTPVRRVGGRHGDGRFFNSIVAVGAGAGEYDKRRLVPFGEYVPLDAWLRGLIGFFDLPMSNFSSGSDEPTLLRAGELRLSPSICYEVAYAAQLAERAEQADLLVNVSDDSWFGDSIGPQQHFEIARVRALETQRPMLRVANSGITAAIAPNGEVIARLPRKTRQTLNASLRRVTGTTPFVRYGSTWVWALAGALALGALAARPRRR